MNFSKPARPSGFFCARKQKNRRDKRADFAKAKTKNRATRDAGDMARRRRRSLDFLVERVALEERIVFLFLNALRDGLFVALGEVARDGFALFAGFGAFEYDDFLHGEN